MLEDIKSRLFSVLLPQHTKIKQQISEILDSELIKQQAQQGVIDFPVSEICVSTAKGSYKILVFYSIMLIMYYLLCPSCVLQFEMNELKNCRKKQMLSRYFEEF